MQNERAVRLAHWREDRFSAASQLTVRLLPHHALPNIALGALAESLSGWQRNLCPDNSTWKLIELFWRQNASERPTMEKILETMLVPK